ncbi:M60 family metallopeptidase [Enterococcus sp. OL5]|uniref:M60 family metallopeptidase n=1 Tax=Enterococcus sp. OL5 TaxID=2590214 RepID=UPI001CB9C0F7|nr:M60 family metallopeptidase [Enterococcus sp. OL5]
MKKLAIVCTMVFCFLGVMRESYAETQDAIENEESLVESKDEERAGRIVKEFIGRGNTEKERIRQLRSYRYSSLEPSGLYAMSGDTLNIELIGQDSLELVIGTPERNTQKKYSLKQGENVIIAENEGAIYITNPNDKGSSTLTISGATGEMPYFDLNTTSNQEFKSQMDGYTNAKDVQLISNKAIITVSYEQAKKNIQDPKQLMEYYDKFLLAQDRVSGITMNGRSENKVDLHFQHFIEVSRLYMFATHEYMGFSGDAALSRLLKTNNGWGIWHESGHQRQQSSWTWRSVVEATVNVYSMAAQKEITGSVTALDQYYAQMHSYLASNNKDFEVQNNNLKMVMFGQLGNTFGELFYPVLHQYYRENKLSYGTNSEKIQNFVINVSKVTGYNMVPYFEEWGFSISEITRERTREFLTLPEKVWLNDNKQTKKLPMRFIDEVDLSESKIDISLTNFETDIFQGQKIVLLKNNKYISELTDKKPYYSSLNNNVWRTNITLFPTDIIRIEVRNPEGTFSLYKSSIQAEALNREILGYLNSENNLSEIITQSKIDELRSKINEITDNEIKENLFDLLELLEERYLESLVKKVSLNEKGDLIVEFNNSKFKEYNKVVILGSDKYIAEIANGIPYYSFLTGNTLRVVQQEEQTKFSIQFRLPHKSYTVNEVDKETLLLEKDIESVFNGDDQLAEGVTQDKLDILRSRISLLQVDKEKTRLNRRLDYAQQLFLELIVTKLEFRNNKVAITFSNELYKNYRVVILEDSKYMAEIANGSPYYGHLNGQTFTTSKSASLGGIYSIQIRHSSGNYIVSEKEFN